MLIPCEDCGVQYETVVTGDAPPHVCQKNLIGHYVVKIYAHDDCPAADRKRLKTAFFGLHDEVQNVFAVQVEGDEWEHDVEYEVTNEMPWDGED